MSVVGILRPAASLALATSLAACAATPIDTATTSASDPAAALAELLAGQYAAPATPSGPALADTRVPIAPLDEGAWLYFERDRDGATYRQRVLQLVNQPGGSVAQTAYTLRDPERFADGASLAGLSSVDLDPGMPDGCEQIWRRVGERTWVGRVDPATCIIKSRRRQTRIRIELELRLDEEGLAEAERGFALDNTQLWGTPSGAFARLARVR